MTPDKTLLNIEKLVLYFNTSRGPVQAVDGVDFSLDFNRAVVILGGIGLWQEFPGESHPAAPAPERWGPTRVTFTWMAGTS